MTISVLVNAASVSMQISYKTWRESHGDSLQVVAIMLVCNIIESEFELQLHYYIHFWTNTLRKSVKPLILPAMSL